MKEAMVALVFCLGLALPALAQEPPQTGQTQEEQASQSMSQQELMELVGRCYDMDPFDRSRDKECERLKEYDLNYILRLRESYIKENRNKTSFLKWLHFGGLWVPGQSGVKMLGVFEAHLAVLRISDRMYFYGPPGFMLLAMAEPGGGWTMRPALSWGMSVYLTDMKLPGTDRPQALYLNLAKVWLKGQPTHQDSPFNQNLTMFGLTFSFDR